MLSLVWFKRDLRVVDHPALALAAAQGPVLPLYIVEPELWAQPDASARQWDFVAECLGDLRADLAALGQPLILRVGDAVEVLARLCAVHRVEQIVSHQETGNGWSVARDQRVADWARGQGMPWVEVPQSGVARAGNARDRGAFLRAPLAEVSALVPLTEGSGTIPGAKALKLAEDRCPNRQRGGRAAGRQALDSFLSARGLVSRRALASPLVAERAGSRLSPWLSWGALSLREVVAASARGRLGRPEWGAALRGFEGRLALRDRALQHLEDEPSLEFGTPDPGAPADPGSADPTLLAAWALGETGLPYVDACMRHARATGWLHARGRGLLMAVARHHLTLDWRRAGLQLARLFTDYEPGIHWSECQRHAGAAVRLVNPVHEGMASDPQGGFLRRWLPELSAVPDAFVHEPWKWPVARQHLAGRYPEPVIDPANATRAARAMLAAQRLRTTAPRLARHRAVASPGAAQMALDL